MQIKLNVNQKNMMGVFGQSFRSNEAVVVELIQNARRAEATDITLVIEDDYLSVSDNGQGVNDWNDLLSVYQSGWEIEGETPFGVGLKGALFICDRLTVYSKGLRFSEFCEDIKAFKPLEVKQMHAQGDLSQWTTIVALDGFAGISLPKLLKMLDGFPVPIKIKTGSPDDLKIIEVDRSHAKTGDFVRAPFGWVEPGYTPGRPILSKDLYYLGVRISLSDNEWKYPHYGPVVHLDPTLFKPTLPDRALLTGESVERLQVMTEDYRLETFVTEANNRWASSDWGWLIDNYQYLKEFNCLHLLNDSPLLGGDLVTKLDDVRNASYQDVVYSSVGDVSVEEVFILDDPHLNVPEFNPDEDGWTGNSLVAVYAYEKELVFLTAQLDKQHPTYKSGKVLNPNEVKVIEVKNPKPVEWTGFYPLFEIESRTPVLCDWVDIDGPAGKVTVIESVVVTENEVLVPANVSPWEAVYQIGNLWSSEMDGYSSDRQYEEGQGLEHWLNSVRAKSPAQAFQYILDRARNTPDGTFLAVIKGGKVVSVEQVD